MQLEEGSPKGTPIIDHNRKNNQVDIRSNTIGTFVGNDTTLTQVWVGDTQIMTYLQSLDMTIVKSMDKLYKPPNDQLPKKDWVDIKTLNTLKK